MHPNAELLERFYRAFDQKDHATMAGCYRDDATFQDPVFGVLVGPRATGMWRMLCSRSADLRVKASEVVADDATGSCRWDADYTFSQTGRFVQNRIKARFTFKDGLIATHVDDFPLWKWMRMALGGPGLVGFLPPVQSALKTKAVAGLDTFLAKEAR